MMMLSIVHRALEADDVKTLNLSPEDVQVQKAAKEVKQSNMQPADSGSPGR